MVRFVAPGVIDGEVTSVVDWPLPASNGGHPMDCVRRYRLKIYDGNYEVLWRQGEHWVDLDLQNGTVYAGVLDRKLVSLAQQARVVENEPMDYPRLEVWDGNLKVLDWTG